MRQFILLLIFAVIISGGTTAVLYQEGIGGMAAPKEEAPSEEYIPQENIEEEVRASADGSVATESAADTDTSAAASVVSDSSADTVTDDAAEIEEPVEDKIDPSQQDDSVWDENGNLISGGESEPDATTRDASDSDKKAKSKKAKSKKAKDTTDTEIVTED